MKRILLMTLITSLAISYAIAQDDVYFTPRKKSERVAANIPRHQVHSYFNDVVTPTTHSGSNRDVDEYNRHGSLSSHYEKVGTDSVGNDIIEFTPGNGEFPDSISLSTLVRSDSLASQWRDVIDSRISSNNNDDYVITRHLSRFDDFYGPYWAWNSFHSPWFYDPWYYDPWYYDPWYYSPWHYTWYDPWVGPGYWHGGWWHGPWIGPWHRNVIVHSEGTPGTRRHGNFSPRRGSIDSGSRSISRGVQSQSNTRAAAQSRGNFSGRRTTTNDYTNTRMMENDSRSYTPSYNNSSSRSSNFGGGGGSFGGGSSRGGFSGGGGSRGGGSGNFGGRR